MVKRLSQSIIVIALLISGCDVGISDRNLVFVTPQDAITLLVEGKSELVGPAMPTVLVDPRPSWRYKKGHIPSAVNIPFGQIHLQMWRFDGVGIIIVAGDTYNDPAAIGLSKELIKQGYKDVRTLRGGLVGWEQAGEPISIVAQ